MHINISVALPDEAPCVKVADNYSAKLPGLEQLFSVTIPGDASRLPRVLGRRNVITDEDLFLVFKFIDVNREVLLYYWYQLDGCQHYIERLRSVK